MNSSYDIVVAGGGLVGAAFAATMAGFPSAVGLRIGVIEKQPFSPGQQQEAFDPRVVAITEASRRLLANAGVWTAEVAARASPYSHMEVRDGEGTGFIEFDSSEVHQNNLGHIVENSVLLAAVNQRLSSLENVTCICQGIDRVASVPATVSTTVSTTVQKTNTTTDTTTGKHILTLDNGVELTAALLVAADGANSLVREQCGFSLRTWDYGHSAIVATIRTAKPHGSTAYQWFSTAGPLALLPLVAGDGDCHYSSIVWSQDHEVASGLMAQSDGDFCRLLTRASEGRLGEVLSVSRRFSFPLHQRHATDYVKPGVALVGDAAHTIHPLAGQGVNLGFGDVAVLAGEIIRGMERGLPVGHGTILERYQRRRKPENLAMMAAMEGFKRLFATANPLVRVLRNRGMSGLNGLSPLKNQLVRRAMGF